MSMYEQFFAWVMMWCFLIFAPALLIVFIYLWGKLIIETVTEVSKRRESVE